MAKTIIAVQESPTNEGTEYYHRGRDNEPYKPNWTVGVITHQLDRVYVFDDKGALRVSLPYASCILHYGGDDE